MTVAMLQGHLFEDPDAAWNAMMAAAILYAMLPVAVFFGLRRYVAGRLGIGRADG
jgi:ABC-type glycerol-3-phosphate transport system permease component